MPVLSATNEAREQQEFQSRSVDLASAIRVAHNRLFIADSAWRQAGTGAGPEEKQAYGKAYVDFMNAVRALQDHAFEGELAAHSLLTLRGEVAAMAAGECTLDELVEAWGIVP